MHCQTSVSHLKRIVTTRGSKNRTRTTRSTRRGCQFSTEGFLLRKFVALPVGIRKSFQDSVRGENKLDGERVQPAQRDREMWGESVPENVLFFVNKLYWGELLELDEENDEDSSRQDRWLDCDGDGGRKETSAPSEGSMKWERMRIGFLYSLSLLPPTTSLPAPSFDLSAIYAGMQNTFIGTVCRMTQLETHFPTT